MAMSNAERQRKHLQQKRDQKALSLRRPDEAEVKYQKRLFSEFYNDNPNLSDFEIPLDMAGISPPSFHDERPACSATGEIENVGDGFSNPLEGIAGSIARAEMTVGLLLEAATVLATFINEFKSEEVSARIAELEGMDLSNPADKKQALTEIIKLNKMRDQLSKLVRRTIPEWKVKGD